MDELTVAGRKLISSKQAGKLTGYTHDYIGQLCRARDLTCRKVGRNWYVDEQVILNHKKRYKQEQALHKRSILEKTVSASHAFDDYYFAHDERPLMPSVTKEMREEVLEEPVRAEVAIEEPAIEEPIIPVATVPPPEPVAERPMTKRVQRSEHILDISESPRRRAVSAPSLSRPPEPLQHLARITEKHFPTDPSQQEEIPHRVSQHSVPPLSIKTFALGALACAMLLLLASTFMVDQTVRYRVDAAKQTGTTLEFRDFNAMKETSRLGDI